MSFSEHGNGDDQHSRVGRDVEHRLSNGVVAVGGALFVFNRHGPVLRERAAVNTIVSDLDDDQADRSVRGKDLDIDVDLERSGHSPIHGNHAGLDTPC